MTQLTMPDRAAHRAVGSPSGAGRHDLDPTSAVPALEARKALLAGAVAAVNAPDRLAAALFEAALADQGARLWPFDLARVHLLYGEWLRQAREITRARQQLRTALAAFEYLGATEWADRAAAELAATGLAAARLAATGLAATGLAAARLAATGLTSTGLTSTGLAAAGLAAVGPTRRPAGARPIEPLTAQELQVAELAAAGLSNKQIGARLYMSHRTVGAHLYRIFPKLGIASRAALRDALSQRAAA
jgi:DNA-binding CsgD family transcriptional regulator